MAVAIRAAANAIAARPSIYASTAAARAQKLSASNASPSIAAVVGAAADAVAACLRAAASTALERAQTLGESAPA